MLGRFIALAIAFAGCGSSTPLMPRNASGPTCAAEVVELRRFLTDLTVGRDVEHRVAELQATHESFAIPPLLRECPAGARAYASVQAAAIDALQGRPTAPIALTTIADGVAACGCSVDLVELRALLYLSADLRIARTGRPAMSEPNESSALN